MNFIDEVKNVSDQKTMANFVMKMANSLSEDKSGWENGDLESFLYALSAWIEDMDGYYQNSGESYSENNISWKNIADMLAASTMYE